MAQTRSSVLFDLITFHWYHWYIIGKHILLFECWKICIMHNRFIFIWVNITRNTCFMQNTCFLRNTSFMQNTCFMWNTCFKQNTCFMWIPVSCRTLVSCGIPVSSRTLVSCGIHVSSRTLVLDRMPVSSRTLFLCGTLVSCNGPRSTLEIGRSCTIALNKSL